MLMSHDMMDISDVSDEDISVMRKIKTIEKEYINDIKLYNDGYYHVRIHNTERTHRKAKTYEGILMSIFNYEKENEKTFAIVFEDFCEDWLNMKRKISTLDSWKRYYKKYIKDTDFDKKSIAEISKKDLILFLKTFMNKYYQQVSERDVSNLFSTINNVFMYARSPEIDLTELDSKLILQDFRKRYFKDDFYKETKSVNDEIITASDEEYLVDLWTKENSLWAKMALFGRLSGLRPGELCALKVEDIHPFEQFLFVKRTEVYDSVNGTHIQDSTKGKGRKQKDGSFKKVYLSDDAIIIYFQILDLRNPNADFLFVEKGHDNRIIRPNLARYIANSSKGLEKTYNTRSLRKTYATDCAQSNMSINLLADQMGHVNIRTALDKYVGNSMTHESIINTINSCKKLQIKNAVNT